MLGTHYKLINAKLSSCRATSLSYCLIMFSFGPGNPVSSPERCMVKLSSHFLQCPMCTNHYNTTTVVPVSLTCGHSICENCLTDSTVTTCPFDQTVLTPSMELPTNSALLWFLEERELQRGTDHSEDQLPKEDREHVSSAQAAVTDIASFLHPSTSSATLNFLTPSMQRELSTIVGCQLVEEGEKERVLRSTRAIAGHIVSELLEIYQSEDQVENLLWTALCKHGYRFLGPAMQEKALRLVLKEMGGGAFLSRRDIVLSVVQQLQSEFPQASRTGVEKVVQLLHRAGCFNVSQELGLLMRHACTHV